MPLPVMPSTEKASATALAPPTHHRCTVPTNPTLADTPVCCGIVLGLSPQHRDALVQAREPFLPGCWHLLLGAVNQKGTQHRAAASSKAQVLGKATE